MVCSEASTFVMGDKIEKMGITMQELEAYSFLSLYNFVKDGNTPTINGFNNFMVGYMTNNIYSTRMYYEPVTFDELVDVEIETLEDGLKAYLDYVIDTDGELSKECKLKICDEADLYEFFYQDMTEDELMETLEKPSDEFIQLIFLDVPFYELTYVFDVILEVLPQFRSE